MRGEEVYDSDQEDDCDDVVTRALSLGHVEYTDSFGRISTQALEFRVIKLSTFKPDSNSV
jgi:hypothetical protein